MELLSRKDAVHLGLKRYFTGAPCKRGHVAARYVTNTGCVACINPKKNIKAHTEFWDFGRPKPSDMQRLAVLQFMRDQKWHMKALEYLNSLPAGTLRDLAAKARETMP